jgi:predicted HTH transcriptional regulator
LVRGNYVSAIRNKQIATLFKEAGIIEKYGSGIKRVLVGGQISNLSPGHKNTIKDHLAALKSENRVERIGSDRDGYWRVK